MVCLDLADVFGSVPHLLWEALQDFKVLDRVKGLLREYVQDIQTCFKNAGFTAAVGDRYKCTRCFYTISFGNGGHYSDWLGVHALLLVKMR